jgi:hypothetical protein
MMPIPAAVAAEVARLVGQDVDVAPDGQSYTIRDIAGEGPPLVGIVERRGDELWLVGDGTVRLVGKLAHPRIAGPGYKVWVIGEVKEDGMHVRRLGVLRPPSRSGG